METSAVSIASTPNRYDMTRRAGKAAGLQVWLLCFANGFARLSLPPELDFC